MTQPSGDPVAPASPPSPTAPPRSDSNFVPPTRYRPESGCAASADHRGDPLFATAPPAERWLLIELNAPWPRNALTALRRSPSDTHTPQADLSRIPQAAPANPADTLAAEIAQLCAQLRCRPVLIRRHGRTPRLGRTPTGTSGNDRTPTGTSGNDRTPAGTFGDDGASDRSSRDAHAPAGIPRRWFLVDSRPGHESIRTGELPTDEHLLAVLSGADPGIPTTDPIYLVCTHGRHDACCAVRGRPAAAALTAAYPDRTWECSHIGGDRFAANLVFLPHSLFYGHVPADQAVPLAQSYNEGTITPTYYRGSGAHPPPVQAAQHFARTTGLTLAVNALHPTSITQPAPNHWSVTLSTRDINGAMDSLKPDSTPRRQPADPEAGTAPASLATNGGGGSATTPHPGPSGVPAEPTRPVGNSTPADSAPADSGPADSAPADSGPADSAPGDSTPADSGLAHSAPADSAPGDSGLAHSGLAGFTSPDGANSSRSITVEVRADLVTVNGQMTCAAKPPGQVRQFTLVSQTRNNN